MKKQKKSGITLELCKNVGDILKGDKTWHKDGNLAIKASKTSNDGHAFYYRDPVKGWTSLKMPVTKTISACKQGGTMTLDEVRAIADAKAKGEVAPISVDVSTVTLLEVLKIRKLNKSKKTKEASLRPKTLKELDYYIGTLAFDWLDLPVADITSKRIADRVRLLNAAAFPNPHFGITIEEARARRERLLAVGEELPRVVRPGREPKLGAKSGGPGAAFVKYLSLVLTGTKSEGHGITRENAPTRSVREEVVIEKNPGKVINAQPIGDDEIAAIFNLSRAKCRNAQSRKFDVIRWQKILATRFALLTGYRCDDVMSIKINQITNGNGLWVEKQAGEVAKSGSSHKLPLSTQAQEIVTEARAMLDGKPGPLAKIGWTEDETATVKYLFFANPSEFLFPSLKDHRSKKHGDSSFDLRPYGQSSAPIRAALDFLETIGHLEERPRKNAAGKDTKPMMIHPHWLRSTLGNKAIIIGAPGYLVSLIMNHSAKNGMAAMTENYVGDAGFDDQKIEWMQKVSDHLFEIAAR